MTTNVTLTLEIEIDGDAWAELYGAGDGYDRRSLVADVEDYILSQVTESAAAHEGAIVSADLLFGRVPT